MVMLMTMAGRGAHPEAVDLGGVGRPLAQGEILAGAIAALTGQGQIRNHVRPAVRLGLEVVEVGATPRGEGAAAVDAPAAVPAPDPGGGLGADPLGHGLAGGAGGVSGAGHDLSIG